MRPPKDSPRSCYQVRQANRPGKSCAGPGFHESSEYRFGSRLCAALRLINGSVGGLEQIGRAFARRVLFPTGGKFYRDFFPCNFDLEANQTFEHSLKLVASHSGRSSINSSPPRRAARSALRMAFEMCSAIARRTVSPAACPWLSLICLEPIEMEKQECEWRAFRLAPHKPPLQSEFRQIAECINLSADQTSPCGGGPRNWLVSSEFRGKGL